MDYKDIIFLISKVLTPSESIGVFQYIDSLREKIVSLSEKMLDLKEQIDRLNTQIADHERWEKEKDKYEIFQQSGAVVYRLKETMQIFCPKCFNDSRVPIHLQPSRAGLFCPKCKNEYRRIIFDTEQKK